jgi:hypothetical protein
VGLLDKVDDRREPLGQCALVSEAGARPRRRQKGHRGRCEQRQEERDQTCVHAPEFDMSLAIPGRR